MGTQRFLDSQVAVGGDSLDTALEKVLQAPTACASVSGSALPSPQAESQDNRSFVLHDSQLDSPPSADDAVEPGGDALEPGADAVEPGADAVEPGADAVEPGGDALEPGADAVEPGGDALEPGADAVEPGGDAPNNSDANISDHSADLFDDPLPAPQQSNSDSGSEEIRFGESLTDDDNVEVLAGRIGPEFVQATLASLAYSDANFASQLTYNQAVVMNAAMYLRGRFSLSFQEQFSMFCDALLPAEGLALHPTVVRSYLAARLEKFDLRCDYVCLSCGCDLPNEVAACGSVTCARLSKPIRMTRDSRYKVFSRCSVITQLAEIIRRQLPAIDHVRAQVDAEAPTVRRELSDYPDFRQRVREHPAWCTRLQLILATDGFPLKGHALGTCWAVFLQIADLPRVIRGNFANTITAAIYLGPTKPDQRDFDRLLTELSDELRAINHDGLFIDGRRFEVEVAFASTDLEASAALFHMRRWNGAFACPLCEHPGESVRDGGARAVFVYPTHATDLDAEWPERTVEGVLRDRRQAVATGAPYKGFLGPATIDEIVVCARRFPDGLHTFGDGFCKDFLRRCAATTADEPTYSLRNRLGVLDQHIADCLLPPGMRPLRSLSTVHTGNATDRLHLTVLAMPAVIIGDFLPDQPVAMINLLLIVAIRIMLLPDLSTAASEDAAQLLRSLRRLHRDVIGPRNCALKMHLILQHIPDLLRYLGTPFDHDTVDFEAANYWLSRCLHDRQSRGVAKGMLELFLLRKDVMLEFGQVAADGECDGLRDLAASWRCLPHAQSRPAVVSVPKQSTPATIPLTLRKRLEAMGLSGPVQVLTRLSVHGRVYASTTWRKSDKSSYSDVVFADGPIFSFGSVICFVSTPAGYFALLSPYETNSTSLNHFLLNTEKCFEASGDFASAGTIRELITDRVAPYGFWRDLLSSKPDCIVNAESLVGFCTIVQFAPNHRYVIDLRLKGM